MMNRQLCMIQLKTIKFNYGTLMKLLMFYLILQNLDNNLKSLLIGTKIGTLSSNQRYALFIRIENQL